MSKLDASAARVHRAAWMGKHGKTKRATMAARFAVEVLDAVLAHLAEEERHPVSTFDRPRTVDEMRAEGLDAAMARAVRRPPLPTPPA